jgi:hypothetical protein
MTEYARSRRFIQLEYGGCVQYPRIRRRGGVGYRNPRGRAIKHCFTNLIIPVALMCVLKIKEYGLGSCV